MGVGEGQPVVTGSTATAIFRKLDNLQGGQAEIIERLAVLETHRTEDNKRVDLFWAKDWAPLVGRVDKVEDAMEEMAKGLASINGLPKKNEARLNGLWKWIGMIGGVGIVSGGIGSFLIQLVLRSMFNGGTP